MSATRDLAPYLMLILVGFLPNEAWRIVGLAVSRGIGEDSQIIIWVRSIATAVLTGVVGKIIVFAPGSLAAVPLWLRIAALALGMAAYFALRQSVMAAVVVGTLAVAAGMMLAG